MTTGDTGKLRHSRRNSSVDGVLVVDKPSGMTSHDVVNRIRRIFGIKRVGHTGTLDPLASGVLVICLGQATRVAEYLTAESKEYAAGITLGIETDSQDSTGNVLTETDSSHITRDMMENALPAFRGRITQIPPMISALHHQGKRLYELARKGIEVERKARPVEIYRLELTSFHSGPRAGAALNVECSTGTYIRTLAADVGDVLGVGAMMHSLRRTRVGQFTIDDSTSIDTIAEQGMDNTLDSLIKTIPEALAAWPTVTLSRQQFTDICHGRSIVHASAQIGPHLLLDEEGAAAAIAQPGEKDLLAPIKVLRNPG